MRTITWITPALATAVHHRLAAEHGGAGTVRDPQALADALAAVPTASTRPDLFALAAAYAAEIAARKPFDGGNVRAAYAVCRTFLSLNGVEIAAAKVDRVLATRQLAAGTIDRHAYAGLLSNQQPSNHETPVTGATAGPSSPVPPFPVRRSVMPFDYQCSRCGGHVAEPGAVHSAGSVYFRPANAKFLTLKTGDIQLRANACTQCGHVDLVADVDKLAALTRRAEPV